jgi:hypothetical protein
MNLGIWDVYRFTVDRAHERVYMQYTCIRYRYAKLNYTGSEVVRIEKLLVLSSPAEYNAFNNPCVILWYNKTWLWLLTLPNDATSSSRSPSEF